MVQLRAEVRNLKVVDSRFVFWAGELDVTLR